jgi:hypothetical protein
MLTHRYDEALDLAHAWHHDAGAIVRDLTLWYYREVLAALEARVGDEPRIGGIVRELGRLVGEMGEG